MARIATAIALALSIAAACAPTPGVPIELTLAFEGLGPRTFTTSSGWEVELAEARALVGPIYAYAPNDATALLSILGPTRALAHGGHHPLDDRIVRAELLDLEVLDALAPQTEVTRVAGLEGAVDALTIVLDAPAGPFAAADGPTHGHHVWVRGVARRDGAEVPFEGGLDLAEVAQRRIEGVRAAADATVHEGDTLIVGADASAWLAEADFDGVIEPALTADGQPMRAIFLASRSAASWGARVETPQE